MHVKFLQQALNLAATRRGFCAPNPAVGAVVVRDGDVVATGVHWESGCPHAEADALHKLNENAHDAILYVTLEPCCHWGKTPPCTDLIIKSGIRAVYYAFTDPNPTVAGKGEQQLRAAGIACQHISLPEVQQFYKSYSHWVATKKPWVTIKLALSDDNKIAGEGGRPIKLTGELLDAYTHQHRQHSDAILTTINTIKNDNPQLNARIGTTVCAKPLYILDSNLQLPVDARIFKTAKSITVFHAADCQASSALLSLGVRCLPVQRKSDGLDLAEVVHAIGEDGVQDLWVEAGAHCFRNMITEKLADSVLLYKSPQTLGDKATPAFSADFILDQYVREVRREAWGADTLIVAEPLS